MEKKVSSKAYYDFLSDYKAFPQANFFIIFGGRYTGKTYSVLNASEVLHKKMCYVKRTNKDIDFLCAGNNFSKKNINGSQVDMSPFKSLNRDKGWNIRAYKIIDGLGGFYRCNEDNEPVGEPIHYCASLTLLGTFRGYDMSDTDWFVFDEFVPKIFNRIQRGEGESVLDAYATISRDREFRGLEPLKLIALANADNASSPLTNILEVTDDIVKLANSGNGYRYIDDRGIFLRKLVTSDEYRAVQKNTAIYRAMNNTQWGDTAMENDFGFNDFSNISKSSLKHFQPVFNFVYKRKGSTCYYNAERGLYYITRSCSNAKIPTFDMAKENDQKLFNERWRFIIRDACMLGKVGFEDYTLYDVIINFTNYFKTS